MFNPVDETAYREVISRWLVILMVILDKVAEESRQEADAVL